MQIKKRITNPKFIFHSFSPRNFTCENPEIQPPFSNPASKYDKWSQTLDRGTLPDSEPTRDQHRIQLFGLRYTTARVIFIQGQLILNIVHLTLTTFPSVIFCRSSAFNSKMALEVPAAAQMVSYCRKSSSRYVSIFWR